MLDDVVTTKLIEAAVGIAKDLLGKRLMEVNERLLKRKLDTEKRLLIEREKTRVDQENERIRKENERLIEVANVDRKSKEETPFPRPKKLLVYKQPNLDAIKVTLEDEESAKGKFTVAVEDLRLSAAKHASSVEDWCRSVIFADMTEQRPLAQVYVELDTFVTPRHLHIDSMEYDARLPLLQTIYYSGSHSVVLGVPGAGKTTSMKRVFLDLLTNDGRTNTLSVPILIRLRNLNRPAEGVGSIAESLLSIFPAVAKFELPKEAPDTVADARLIELEVLGAFLDSFGCLILLDGFDEIANAATRQAVLEEFRVLARSFRKSKLVLTCRTGEFKEQVDKCRIFEIAPLDDGQVRNFALNWLGEDGIADRFIEAIRKTPFYDTTIRPLSLAHLCTIYKRIGKIPDRPKTVYRKIVTLLLEDWDHQHENKRVSRYGMFEPDRKFEFLCNMAFLLTTEYRVTSFSLEQMSEVYLKICVSFGLPTQELKVVMAELESHTGLLVQAGFENFEFAHKSLQEFLAAEYIVKLPKIPSGQHMKMLANELAIAVSISSNPSLYLVELVLGTFVQQKLPDSFYDAFVNRLCLERPSFTAHSEVILAGFTLITLAENSGRLPRVKEGDLRRETQLMAKYEDIFASLRQKNSLDILKFHYRPSTDQSYVGSTYMKRVRALDSFSLPHHLLIPNQLLSRDPSSASEDATVRDPHGAA